MEQAKVSQLFTEAMDARKSGNLVAAEQKFEMALALDPANPAILNSLGVLHLDTGQSDRAVGYFQQAMRADPKAPELAINLAKAQRSLGDDDAEALALQRALEIDQRHLMANVRLAELHERRGEAGQAMMRWTGVLALTSEAQGDLGALKPLLEHGRAFVADCARKLDDHVSSKIDPLRSAMAPGDVRRFDACVDAAMGRRRIYHNECHGLHFPFLPADEFFERKHFDWLESLEAKTEIIRSELEGVLRSGAGAMQPYVRQDPGTPSNKWSDLDHSERWSAWFLWHHGKRVEENCEICPQTASILDSLPLARIPGKGPTAFFSILHPKTTIPPHTGVTNTRAIVHLPLIVPDGCRFRVGGDVRPWRVGEAFAFDDTISHEAWNDSDELRAVLIFDVWNPHLSEEEKNLLITYFEQLRTSGLDPFENAVDA